MKHTYLLLLVLLIPFFAESKKLPGYIITNENDTIKGDIKVYKFNRRTGGLMLGGIDLEWNYIEVSFKEYNSRKFKTYTPNEIKEYSFKYNNDQFYFLSEKIPLKSIIPKERNKKHFALLVYKDKDMILFKHQKYVNCIEKTLHPIYLYFVRLNNGTIYKLDKFIDL